MRNIRISLLAFIFLVLMSLAAWSRGKSEQTSQRPLFWNLNQSRTVVSDGSGNTVPVAVYKKIVVASPGAVETLYMIGAESAVVAIADSIGGTWPQDRTSALPTVGSVVRPSLEKIISFSPDLIIVSGMSVQLAQDLSSRGFNTLVHNAESIEDIFNSTIILGKLTGYTKEATKLVSQRRAALEHITSQSRKQPLSLKGAFLYSANPPMAFTEKSLPGEILNLLGVQNIAAGLDSAQPIISPEKFIVENPDFLFAAMRITTVDDLLAPDSAILRTRAGRERNIRIVPSSLFLRPSPRIIEGILDLRTKLEVIERGKKHSGKAPL